MITDFLVPQLAIPGRIAAFLVACILMDGALFRSKSSPFRSFAHTVHDSTSASRTPLLRRINEVKTSPVPVTISIESLCVDTKNFFASQLMRTYETLGPSVMDLSLVVFGNAHLDETTRKITCQHGEAECSANSYMQCAMDRFPSTERYLPFVNCLFETLSMGHNDEPFPASDFAHCAHHSALDWHTIQSCHEDPEESWKLQYQSKQNTPTDLNHVPWVQVAGYYMSEETSLLQAVCDAYVRQGGQHPSCVTPSAI